MIVHDIVHDNTTTTTRSSHVSIESVPGPWMWGLDSAEAAIGAAGSSTQRYPSFVWNRDHWWSDLINQDLGIKNYQKECNYTQFKPQHYSSWPHCAFIFHWWVLRRYRSVGVGKARKWVFVVASSYHGWKCWSWQSDNPYHVSLKLGCKETIWVTIVQSLLIHSF